MGEYSLPSFTVGCQAQILDGSSQSHHMLWQAPGIQVMSKSLPPLLWCVETWEFSRTINNECQRLSVQQIFNLEGFSAKHLLHIQVSSEPQGSIPPDLPDGGYLLLTPCFSNHLACRGLRFLSMSPQALCPSRPEKLLASWQTQTWVPLATSGLEGAGCS